MATDKDIEKTIRKLYKQASESEDIIDPNDNIHDVLSYCEKNKILTGSEDEKNFFGFVKTKKDSEEVIRMIFIIKQGKKKVFNIHKIMNVIRCVENVLTFVDSCITTEEDGKVYLDVYKQLA